MQKTKRHFEEVLRRKEKENAQLRAYSAMYHNTRDMCGRGFPPQVSSHADIHAAMHAATFAASS